MKRLLCVVALCGLASCTVLRGSPSDEVRLFAVGDSILAWNRRAGQDIPAIVSRATGLPVFNNAISGAEFVGRFAVPNQYIAGDWDWLIVDGGGNDLTGQCGTPAASDAVLDRLIDNDDLSGAYTQFLAPLTAQGTRVVLMGYMPISVAGGPFAPCRAALDDLRDRQMRLAASMAGVYFVDTRSVVKPDNLAAYDDDLVHPSPLGGRLIGRQIADVIAANP